MQQKQNLNRMRKKIIKYSATFVAISALSIGINAQDVKSFIGMAVQGDAMQGVGHADLNTLKVALNNWRSSYEANGGNPEVLRLALGSSRVLTDTATKARGHFQFNLKTGEATFQAKQLETGHYDLWLVDSKDGSVRPKAEDNMIRLGSFDVTGDGIGRLEARLERSQLLGFTMDSIVVSEAGKSPVEKLVLSGAPGLMHKLYYADKPWLTTSVGDFATTLPENSTPFEFLLPKVAQADAVSDLAPILGQLVAEGRQIFHHETFDGNGRTCGTCHREDNNFTLDPNYIMKLPPSDPLFVAETNPELADLEDSVLLRKHALIKTNIDGFGGPDIFRSVPHTLAMFTSIDHECTASKADGCTFGDSGFGGEFAKTDGTGYVGSGGEFSQDNHAFAHSTGWSGDGAPGTGSLREFTLGAITQHNPKTMARRIGIDFRLATEHELDAVEAYMLSLGRSKDYPIYQIQFKDTLVQAGKELFDSKVNPVVNGQPMLGETANCNGCHQNAGARSSSTKANPTRNTGIENMKIHPARLLKPDMAYDGGFGTEAAYCGSDAGDTPNCFGDGRFSTPPLIEAADTAPYFHNNAVSTLEEAIAAYNSDAFNTSPGSNSKGTDRRIKLDSTQVVAIASFLRSINALENMRMSDQLSNQAKQINDSATARDLVKLAKEENLDAVQVLKEGVLGNNWKAVQSLEKADYFLKLAQLSPARTLRNSMLNQALAQTKQARGFIVQSCDPTAVPSPEEQANPLVRKVPSPADEFVFSCAELGLDALGN